MKARIPAITSAKQRKALDSAINDRLAEHMRAHEADYIALVLWTARTTFRFGRKRLLRFAVALVEACRELERHYEMPNGGMYLAKVDLKRYGIDIDELVRKNEIFDFEVK